MHAHTHTHTLIHTTKKLQSVHIDPNLHHTHKHSDTTPTNATDLTSVDITLDI